MYNKIQDALQQVQQLREKVIDGQKFHGYSGPARITGGVLALLMAILLNTPQILKLEKNWDGNYWYHPYLIGWGVLAVLGMLINYGAVAKWFYTTSGLKGNLQVLRPLIDAFIPNITGAILTLAVIKSGDLNLLYPIWLTSFGMMNFSSRRFTSEKIGYLGIYYLIWGAITIFLPNSFSNPLILGLIFCGGEITGGLIFIQEKRGNLKL